MANYKARPTYYRGTLYRSEFEAKWQIIWDLMKLRNRYEAGSYSRWRVDFLVELMLNGEPFPVNVEAKAVWYLTEDEAVKGIAKIRSGQGYGLLVGLDPTGARLGWTVGKEWLVNACEDDGTGGDIGELIVVERSHECAWDHEYCLWVNHPTRQGGALCHREVCNEALSPLTDLVHGWWGHAQNEVQWMSPSKPQPRSRRRRRQRHLSEGDNTEGRKWKGYRA